MQTYTLRFDGPFVDPLLINALRGGTRMGATVQQDGSVQVHVPGFSHLHLLFADAEHPGPGTEVVVFLSRDLSCYTLADWEIAKAEQRAVQEAQQARERAETEARAAADRAFNQALGVPVAWDTDYKPVLSGLRAGSWGDGTNRATVIHVKLQEELHEGKLHRAAGDLLCSASVRDRGSFAELHGDRPARFEHAGVSWQPRVTCKECLRIAQRWSTNEQTTSQT